MHTILNRFGAAQSDALLTASAVVTAVRLDAQQPAVPSEADQIREELRMLKRDYETRIRALEERLNRLQSGANDGVKVCSVRKRSQRLVKRSKMATFSKQIEIML